MSSTTDNLCEKTATVQITESNNNNDDTGTNREDYVMDRMKDILQEYHLSQFSSAIAMGWIKESLCNTKNDQPELFHMKEWLMAKINGRKRDLSGFSPWQRGCPELIPKLTSRTFWDTDQFSWVKDLEASYESIKSELLTLKGKKGFQQYRSPDVNADKSEDSKDNSIGAVSHDAGDWNVFYLYLHNIDFSENREKVPETMKLIDSIIPRNYTHAFFSAVAPKTHITKHHGPTNKKLRCHIPLVVPEGKCRIRVGDDIKVFEEGKCIIFDDSHEHEVWNDSESESRIVLIVDLWHPELLEKEVKFFGFLQKAEMRAGKHFSEKQDIPANQDFYSVIKKGHEIGANEDMIWNN